MEHFIEYFWKVLVVLTRECWKQLITSQLILFAYINASVNVINSSVQKEHPITSLTYNSAGLKLYYVSRNDSP